MRGRPSVTVSFTARLVTQSCGVPLAFPLTVLHTRDPRACTPATLCLGESRAQQQRYVREHGRVLFPDGRICRRLVPRPLSFRPLDVLYHRDGVVCIILEPLDDSRHFGVCRDARDLG